MTVVVPQSVNPGSTGGASAAGGCSTSTERNKCHGATATALDFRSTADGE
jgi:hypothetical protein